MDGAVAVLSMHYKPHNLLDKQMTLDVVKGLDWARQQNARAVVLRSALRHFSSGADLDAIVEAAEETGVL